MNESDKQRYKNRILTDLYNQGEIHRKVEGICWRNFIPKESDIHSDCVQEVFYNLAKKPADFIIELYESDPRRLVGLSVTIAIMKCVSHNKNNRDYTRQWLARHILQFSNFQKSEYLSPTESYEPGGESILVDESTEQSNEEALWELIRSNLTSEENEALEFFLSTKKRQGRYKKDERNQLDHLLERITNIVNNNRINMMNQETILNNIEKLMPVLKELQTTGTATINQEQKLLLQNTYMAIFKGVQMNLTCATCINSYLNNLCAYYERENPKFLASSTTLETPDTTDSVEAVPAPTKKTKKKNNTKG